ncbi:TIGR04255 family protein [bacterium]|nr:TIGR04255 family protein [bacterium]
MNYDSIGYKMACVSQVIIRLDFREFIDASVLFGQDTVEDEVLKKFPKKGLQQLVRFQTMSLTTDQNGAKVEQTAKDGVQQEYSNIDGNKITLSNKALFMEIEHYTKFEDIMSMFLPVLKALLDKQQLTVMRTGIRYVNLFGEEKIKPQKKFFVPNVGALLETKFAENGFIRSMAMNEYLVDDMRLNFRYGMYNPQYPQPMKKVNYVLDYDCFCSDALDGFDVIKSHIQKGHDSIQNKFENSITDQLRKVMENG